MRSLTVSLLEVSAKTGYLTINQTIRDLLLALTLCFLFFALQGCQANEDRPVYQSKSLEIYRVTPSTYRHVSFLPYNNTGIPCNGMIVVQEGEALIFDTPNYDSVSVELINWVETRLNARIRAVIPTHFHIDCLGGLAAFHERSIPSWAHERTRTLAADSNMVVPVNGFEEKKMFQLGNETVLAEFNGEGHTRCNITAYYPPEQVLFGGCLVKSMNAGKGNLADANVPAWPETMQTIKQKYPKLEVVIPGHGPVGGAELLDYTARLFAATR